MTTDRTKLDQAVRAHYESQLLRAGLVDELLANEQEPPGRESSPPPRFGLAQVSVAIAAVLLVAAVAFQLLLPGSGSEVAMRVRQEVATNHLKLRSPEVMTGDLERLRREMTELDFHLIDPDVSPTEGTLVGGRYCSIDGQLAAQLRYQNAEGRAMTLYQTRLSETLEELTPGAATVDGVTVRLWQEDGLFLALARGVTE